MSEENWEEVHKQNCDTIQPCYLATESCEVEEAVEVVVSEEVGSGWVG